MSPGIVDAVEEASPGTIRSKHVDSRYGTKKIGSVLSILETTGDLEDVSTGANRSYLYELAVDSLEPARQDASEIYSDKIYNSWQRVSPRPEPVIEDITERGITISETSSGVEKLTQLRNDYHEDTLDFLDRADIIEDVDSRLIVADDVDIEILEENLEAYVSEASNVV